MKDIAHLAFLTPIPIVASMKDIAHLAFLTPIPIISRDFCPSPRFFMFRQLAIRLPPI
jgi:hypothetical protein